MKRRWLEQCKNVEELASQYKRHPLSSAYRPRLFRLWEPSSVWRLFPRQDPAFQFAKTCKEDVHVFALETVLDDTERRLYLVTTYTEFWFYYIKHPQTLAHCYEVIPADTVCKLYFDLEFYKPANPGADGRKMVAVVIEFFSRKLDECFGVKCSADCVLNLDSSTEEKFSRHLIFILHNAAFKDNIHVGNFIKSALLPLFSLNERTLISKDPVCGTSSKDSAAHCENAVRHPQHAAFQTACTASRDMIDKDCDLSCLIVVDKNGGKQLFIDLGVYTKNRNFRLYKSSKLGKNVVFDLSDDNTFAGKPPKHVSTEENIFLCSLISNVRYFKNFNMYKRGKQEERDCKPQPWRVYYFSLLSSTPGIVKGYQFSPYPEIDYFILSLVTREGFHGGIRQWNYFSLEELLVYDTINYRWCENIGRAHRSNNVMLLVDLKREEWYQKCYDPVCRAQNFKSDCYRLPLEVCLPFILKEEVEECSLTMDENGNIREDKQNLMLAEGQGAGRTEENIRTCDRDWENGIDDASIAEAAEDAELADAADHSLVDWSLDGSDIPDELLLEAFNDTSVET